MPSFHCMKPELQSKNCGTCLNFKNMKDSDVLLRLQNIEISQEKETTLLLFFPSRTMVIISVICVGKTDSSSEYSEENIFINRINLKTLSLL